MTENLINLLPDPPQNKTGWPWTEGSEPLPERMPDGSPWPKISIVTPSYNQAQYLEETIRSVLLQGYPNLEYIIIDGSSTDGSVEIIKKYEPWLAFWESKKDRGQSHAINKGIRKATGDILFWLNADDICLPNAFSLVSEAFSKNPDKKLVIGQTYVIDKQSEVIGEMRSDFSTWEDIATRKLNHIRQVSTFFSIDLFYQLGLINEELIISMDNEILIRFTKKYTPLIIDQYLSAFRVHEKAKSQNDLILGYKEIDCIRPKILNEKKLIQSYRTNSSKKWLFLSKSTNYTNKERISCLFNSLRNKPGIIFGRAFWSSLKNIFVNYKNDFVNGK